MQRRENNIQSFEKLRLVSSSYFLVVVMEIVNHIILHSWFSCISFVGVGESFMFFPVLGNFLDKYRFVLNWKPIDLLYL
jgi:hypothetical protein